MIYSSDDNPSDQTKIAAILLFPIQYTKCEIQGEINVPANTMVYIDTENSVALIGDDHVDIAPHEYRLLMS